MLQAGVPLGNALDTVSSSGSRKCRAALKQIAKSVSTGNHLAASMAGHKMFKPLDLMMIEVGEHAGNLPEILELLAQWYEFYGKMKKIIISGLMLPAFVLHVAAVAMPAPRLFLGQIGIDQYIVSVISILCLFYIPAGVIIAIMRFTPTSGPLRGLLDRVVLRIPILGRGIRHMSLSRYCRAFQILCRAGVPAVQCAQKAADVTGNTVVRSWVAGAADSARRGNLFSEGFSGAISREFLEMWRVGEETGELDESCRRLSDRSAESAEWIFAEFSKWLPRVVYFIICIFMAINILRGYQAISGALYGLQ